MIWEALSRFLREWLHHLPRSFYVAAVIASGVHILNNNNLPLELPATTLLASVAQLYESAPPARPDARSRMAVVEIDAALFEDRYDETSPLDRCKLREDLENLLENPNIRVLAIDLDMSPKKPREYQEAYAGLQQNGKTPDDLPSMHRCQYLLEQFLSNPLPKTPERPLSIIAISPLKPTLGRDASLPWDNPNHFPNIRFGEPGIETRFGMAHDYEFPPHGYAGDRQLTFAEFITRALCDVSASDTKNDRPKGCDQVPSASTPSVPAKTDKFKSYPVSHFQERYLYNRGAPSSLDTPCFNGSRTEVAPGEACDIRVVVLGGTFGIEDKYLTPVGWMSGLRMHAAIAAQVRAHTWHGWGFLGDVLIGGLFLGPLVHGMWSAYYRQRTGTLAAESNTGHPRMAYWWLLGLGLLYFALVAFFAVFSVWLYANGHAWISPVPIALALLLESAVSGSVHAAVHKVEHEMEHARSTITGLERSILELDPAHAATTVGQPPTPHGSRRAPWLAYLPTAVAVSLIACVVFSLIREL